jgi:uncharacterized caspase-like protein
MIRRAIVVLLALMLTPPAAYAETRVALVVGVGNYDSRELARLPNAVNDARAIHAALERYGFQSELVLNPTRQQLRAKLSEMWDMRGAETADAALVFFAGHGITFSNQGYLLARDSSVGGDRTKFDTSEEVQVARLLEAVAGAHQAILLLDACRTSSAVSERLAYISGNTITSGVPLRPASGSIISYSAELGTGAYDGNGENSPYTEGLLAHMADPGL